MNKKIVNLKKETLIEMTSLFCDKNLDDDYKQLCKELIEKMARKRAVPFVRGRLNIWAASIIHAIGTINFLFDSSFRPYSSLDTLVSYFKASKSTTSQKSKLIRDMFKLTHYDLDFSTSKMEKSNPFNEMVMINGYVVPKSFLYELE